ncbi:unnamed protein product [Lymnaea stagnalis]|uniref:Globin n=1 Tax=Lymnaea stagnalis TaxID=6523 RepID=A0AAV2H4U9_LYMST
MASPSMADGGVPKEYLTVRCPITNLTDEEKAVLKSSWKRVVGSSQEEFAVKGVEFGRTFLHWMFANIPDMKKQFEHLFDATKSPDVLNADVQFQKHVNKIITWIDSMMEDLDHPSKLQLEIFYLSQAHINRKNPIGIKFFGPLQKKFPSFIAGALGLPEDHQEVKMWILFIDLLVNKVRTTETWAKDDKKGCCNLL